jgi:hypothetical protein
MARSLLSVRRLIRHRSRIGPKMRAALDELGRLPVRSFRQVAQRHGVDLGDLHRLAATVPGLLEARRAQQGETNPQRAAAA